MEWVRACFKSKWKTFRGSPRLRAGYYYFAVHGTPHYPGVHNLGSRDWVSDNGYEDAPLGEWAGARGVYNGDPPELIPLPLLVGDKDCVKMGENPDLPGDVDKCEREGILMPRECYDARELAEKKTNVWDCAFAYKMARILSTQYAGLSAAAGALSLFFEEEADVTPFPQETDAYPNCIVSVKDNHCMVLITGTTNFQQLALQMLHFGLGARNQGEYSTSDLYESAAIVMATRINLAGGGDCTRFTLIGHSYGAAIAIVLAAKIRVADNTKRVELLTFGCPKPGDERLAFLIRTMKQTNWVNEGDPIPYMPPEGVSLIELSFAVPLLLFGQWAAYRRPASVVVLGDDGSMEHTLTARINGGVLASAAVTIAAGGEPEPFQTHFMSTYVTRLRRGCKHLCEPQPASRYKVTMTNLLCTIISESELVPEIIFYCEYDPDEEKWFHPYDGQKGAAIGLDDDYPTVPNAFEFNYSSDTLLLITSATFSLPDDWFLGCEIGYDSLIPTSEFRFGTVESIRIEAADLV